MSCVGKKTWIMLILGEDLLVPVVIAVDGRFIVLPYRFEIVEESP